MAKYPSTNPTTSAATQYSMKRHGLIFLTLVSDPAQATNPLIACAWI